MVACMMALLLMGVFGNDINIGGSSLAGPVVLFSMIAVGWIFLQSAGIIQQITWFDSETFNLIVAILVFGLIVFFITKEDDHHGHGDDHHKASVMDGLAKVLGGGGGGDHH